MQQQRLLAIAGQRMSVRHASSISSSKKDAIIVGGGHNGLVTAAYLAKAGHDLHFEHQEKLLIPCATYRAISSRAGTQQLDRWRRYNPRNRAWLQVQPRIIPCRTVTPVYYRRSGSSQRKASARQMFVSCSRSPHHHLPLTARPEVPSSQSVVLHAWTARNRV